MMDAFRSERLGLLQFVDASVGLLQINDLHVARLIKANPGI